MHRYFLIHKPYGMLSQFTVDSKKYKTLADLGFEFPKDVYAVGRLDADSEGLLLLTNDKAVNHRLLQPGNGHKRTYFVQVDFAVTEAALSQLRNGVNISINGESYHTKSAGAEMIQKPDWIGERVPAVRFRKEIPTSWISITLREGKNRQVRRMTASVGHPTLRLVRQSIEQHAVDLIQPGEVIELNKIDFYLRLGW